MLLFGPIHLPFTVCKSFFAIIRKNVPTGHRRRMIKTEEKAKVIASVWGQELFQLN